MAATLLVPHSHEAAFHMEPVNVAGVRHSHGLQLAPGAPPAPGAPAPPGALLGAGRGKQYGVQE